MFKMEAGAAVVENTKPVKKAPRTDANTPKKKRSKKSAPAKTTTAVSNKKQMVKRNMTTTRPAGMMLAPPHPSYFNPKHKVLAVFKSTDNEGFVYTQGLHPLGFPELFAENVPRDRIHLVSKNMYFLGSRMAAGVVVDSGHRSTDHDYRVGITEILQDEYRLSVLYHYMSSCDPQSRVLVLHPYYSDCEQWGGFPPAPHGERQRRNRLLAAIFFHCDPRVSTEAAFDRVDAQYVLNHSGYFLHVLQVSEIRLVVQMMPSHLQRLVLGCLSSPLPTLLGSPTTMSVEDSLTVPLPHPAAAAAAASTSTSTSPVMMDPHQQHQQPVRSILKTSKTAPLSNLLKHFLPASGDLDKENSADRSPSLMPWSDPHTIATTSKHKDPQSMVRLPNSQSILARAHYAAQQREG